MQKSIVMISSVVVFALATFSANACPFGEQSASMEHDKVASALPKPAKTATSEAMSTFDPKHPPMFETSSEATKEPAAKKELAE